MSKAEDFVPLSDVPDALIPPKVRNALERLIEAINESGPRCIGTVITITFDNGEVRVVPWWSWRRERR